MEQFLANLIKQRLLICLAFVFVIIGGVFAYCNLPIDAFPDLTNVQVQVITEAPGMPPIEAEQLVTVPIESILNGLPKVEQVRSVSKFGLSIVTVVFQDNVNTYFARQLVNERLQSARSRLPDGISPQLGPITTGMGEIYQYVVEGKGYTARELKTLHDWDIKYQLRTVPGVNEVNTWGGQTQEYVITLFPERLTQYDLTLQNVFAALKNNNENYSGGIIEHGAEQYIIRGLGRVETLDDIGNIVVSRKGTMPVTLKNIAQIGFGNALRQGAVTKDGQGEVVTGLVMMLKGENSREVIERVKEKVRQIRKSLPEGIQLKPFYDQTRLVEQTIHTVQTNLLEGSMLVIAVLLLLLGNLRAALIVAVVIPISMMFSLMGMKALGLTANIMSLGAIDFGMIVDGAIVMVENTVRKLAHAEPGVTHNTEAVVQQSLKEMARPILFGILIITVVYMPILALEGMEYKMFSPMVFAVCFALLGSLICALTLVPVLCTFFLKGKVKERESFFIQKIRPAYLNLLKKALAHRNMTVSITVALFIVTVASVPFLGTEFVPQLDEGDILIETVNLPSISLAEKLKVTTQVEQSIGDIPEIETAVSKLGRPDLATDPMGVYQADVYVMLNPKQTWRSGITKEKLIAEIDRRLNRDIPGTHFNFTQPIAMRVDELVSGVRSDIAIKLFGEDFKVLAEKAQDIERVMRSVKGQRDLQTEKLEGSSQIVITPDRTKMARYGVQISDMKALVGTAVLGEPVSEVLEGRKRFTMRVKFPGGSQTNPLLLQSLLLDTSTGQRIPLGQVATIRTEEGLEVINRESAQRRIVVMCNVDDRDIGSFVREGQQKIKELVQLPPGYYIEWGGQFENQQRAMQKLMMVVPLSIVVIFLLLMATFSSVRHSLLVMLNVPFALIGGVIALWLRGMYLNVPAFIGFIALFGVAVLNGLVLVSTINQYLKEGHPLSQAIQLAAETRLRPVLMTALVAILGFMPMALSHGAGAEVQKPLATVVIGGVFTSTFLTLIVLPVIYGWTQAVNGNLYFQTLPKTTLRSIPSSRTLP
ncbi:efflux RND transporter permease subunit [Vampirovibrio sp.]|uniref:efflux RND transporter permease subunit n=1 Tax=Vampirovibrio sp. TaxID=2717857 RepID=UPI00359409D7